MTCRVGGDSLTNVNGKVWKGASYLQPSMIGSSNALIESSGLGLAPELLDHAATQSIDHVMEAPREQANKPASIGRGGRRILGDRSGVVEVEAQHRPGI